MKMWKGSGNTTTQLFSLKGLEILYTETRGEVHTILMEHLKNILFQKSGPANKQYTNQSINQSINQPHKRTHKHKDTHTHTHTHKRTDLGLAVKNVVL